MRPPVAFCSTASGISWRREQHTAHLAVGQLHALAAPEALQPEERQGAAGGRPVCGGGRIVEPDAGVAAGLHDLIDREVMGMIGLQVCGDEAGAPLEFLQGNAWLYSCSLDAATRGNAMVAIQSAQQSGLARAVGAVDEPALAGAHLE